MMNTTCDIPTTTRIRNLMAEWRSLDDDPNTHWTHSESIRIKNEIAALVLTGWWQAVLTDAYGSYLVTRVDLGKRGCAYDMKIIRHIDCKEEEDAV